MMKTPECIQIDQFFSNQKIQIALYKAIIKKIKELGSVQIEVMKSQISFKACRKFAWVWIPKPWAKRPKNSLVLTISLRRNITSTKIAEAVEPYPGRWTHHIIIKSENDLDQAVLSWLQEAYLNARSG